MECREIFERGLRFHHYCNTAYPLRPYSLVQYEVHSTDDIYRVVQDNIRRQKELCLYVHVPFCQSRCKFCEYVVMNHPEDGEADRYVDHLLKEIYALEENK